VLIVIGKPHCGAPQVNQEYDENVISCETRRDQMSGASRILNARSSKLIARFQDFFSDGTFLKAAASSTR
jgi:hypothetical protein